MLVAGVLGAFLLGCGGDVLRSVSTSDGGTIAPPGAPPGSPPGTEAGAPGCPATTGLVTIASGQAMPTSIAVNAAGIYWLSNVGLMKAPLCGGAATVLVPSTPAFLPLTGQIAVDSMDLYFGGGCMSGAAGCGGWESAMKVSIDGGAPVAIAPTGITFGVRLYAGALYWLHAGVGVETVGLSGGAPSTVVAGPALGNGLAVSAAGIFWADPGNGTLMRTPLAGGPPTVLVTGVSTPGWIIADDGNVVWAEESPSDSSVHLLRTVPATGGTPLTLAEGIIGNLATDGVNVYWTDHDSPASTVGSVMRVPLGGGTPTTLASGQSQPWDLAVDGTSVYWTTGDDCPYDAGTCASGTVMKLTPK